MFENESSHKVKLGDDYQYPIKGSGEASYKIDSDKTLKMKYVLYVLGLKKNLLSIFALDAKGIKVARKDNRLCNINWRARGRIVQLEGAT